MTEQERIHLTIGRLAPCVWSIVANRSVDYHKDGSKRILLSGGTYFPMDDEEQMTVDPSLSKFLVEACKWVFTEVVEPALQMGVTAEEFALLRVICFLTPGNFKFELINLIYLFSAITVSKGESHHSKCSELLSVCID